MTMEQVSFSFRQTVFGILKTLVVRASQNNLDLTYDVDPDIPDQLVGDAFVPGIMQGELWTRFRDEELSHVEIV